MLPTAQLSPRLREQWPELSRPVGLSSEGAGFSLSVERTRANPIRFGECYSRLGGGVNPGIELSGATAGMSRPGSALVAGPTGTVA